MTKDSGTGPFEFLPQMPGFSAEAMVFVCSVSVGQMCIVHVHCIAHCAVLNNTRILSPESCF
jgi:hypothetical protein